MELDWNQIVMRGKSGIGVSEADALAITGLREGGWGEHCKCDGSCCQFLQCHFHFYS